MKIDLKNMTRKQLEKLRVDVEKAIDKLRKKDLRNVRQEMEKLAAAHGVTVEDVMGGKAPAKKAPKAKAQSVPKFANPDDKSQTWTGKGRQPVWYKSAIDAGKSPASMAI